MCVVRGWLTTRAQRTRPQDAGRANHDAMPGSLQRMVSVNIVILAQSP